MEVVTATGNVIEVEELQQRNRRELLLLEEEQGCFPRRLVLLCLLCNRTSAAQLNTVTPSGLTGRAAPIESSRTYPTLCAFFPS